MPVTYTLTDSSRPTIVRDPSRPVVSDPYDHLNAEDWVDVQIAWCTNNICGRSLIPALQTLKGDLVGLEIGVCLGTTADLFLKTLPNIKKYHAVNPYPTYVDGDSAYFDEGRQVLTKKYAFENLSKHGDRVSFEYVSSDDFAKTIPDNYLDFIFIDGDHSYEGALKDIANYYPKVKSGGIFAGHDYYWPGVNRAIGDFLTKDYDKINILQYDVWYVEKK